MSGATLPVPGITAGAREAFFWNGSAWVAISPPTQGNITAAATGGTPIAFDGSASAESDSLGGGNDFGDGRGGNDVLFGLGGNDVLVGSAGRDSLDGGADADTLVGGNATISGALGTGSLTVAAANDGTTIDTMTGGAGNDTYIVTSGSDVIQGTAGDGTDTALIASNATTIYTVSDAASVEVLGVLDPSLTTGVNLSATGTEDQVITGGAGADTLSGGGGEDTLDGAAGADRLVGGADDDLLVGGGGDILEGGAGNDTFQLSGSGNILDGGEGAADVVSFATPGTYTVTGGPGAFNISGPGSTLQAVTNMEFIAGPGGDTVFGAGEFNVCFASGTRIMTSVGEVAVERLQAGDLVATLAGRGSPMKPVLWIGRRRVMLAGHAQADAIAPIRIRAGALGANVPHRDLLVSPDHCLFLDGALVPARLLVDGCGITVERGLAEVTYFHVELAAHDVLLAEGAAAESWLDCANRSWFENAPVARLSVDGTLGSAGTGYDAARACAPLVHGGERLAAIRAAIAGNVTPPIREARAA